MSCDCDVTFCSLFLAQSPKPRYFPILLKKRKLSVWSRRLHGRTYSAFTQKGDSFHCWSSWVLCKPLRLWPCSHSCGSFILTAPTICPRGPRTHSQSFSLSYKAPHTCPEKLGLYPSGLHICISKIKSQGLNIKHFS